MLRLLTTDELQVRINFWRYLSVVTTMRFESCFDNYCVFFLAMLFVYYNIYICLGNEFFRWLPIVAASSEAAAALTAAVTEALTFGDNTLSYDETRNCFTLDFSASQLCSISTNPVPILLHFLLAYCTWNILSIVSLLLTCVCHLCSLQRFSPMYRFNFVRGLRTNFLSNCFFLFFLRCKLW